MDVESAENLVLETLKQATSQNADLLKPAEQTLKQWETESGFYSVLVNIFTNHSLDVNVRWLAVLYFKNGIDRYWRKTAPNAISEAEKTSIRLRLQSYFCEPTTQIATQIAVLISKMARLDCPREWPELIPTLLNGVKNEDSLTQDRALLIFHHVIKTLSSKRLAGDRRLFQDLTENVFPFVLSLWESHLQNFLAQPSASTSDITLSRAILLLKILRKLTIHGFKKPNEDRNVVNFLRALFERAPVVLVCRRSAEYPLVELCEKFVVHMSKVLLDFLEHHPISFVDLIQPSLEFSFFYAFSPGGTPLSFERFVVQCLNLIKLILTCAEYKVPKVIEEVKNVYTLRAHENKTNFFTSNVLTEMCQKLVSHYFLLTQEDLKMWDENPEGFATDEGGESWKYSLRPCTESLFLGLFHEFRSILSPVLLDMIRNNHVIVPPHDLEAILRKDAVYNAVGLAAFDLYDEVDFDNWFSTTLTQELQINEGHYRVIRRRVAWLMGRWSGVKFSTTLRPNLYRSILPLLQPTEDMAVRLAASNALKLAVDDFEFDTDQFLPYLESVFNLLFNLLREARECDTKMHVLYVLSFVVERVGCAIRPYSDSLLQYLPLLWEESADHNMLRCAIVSTLVHLVNALGSIGEVLSAFLLPIIALATDTTQDAHVYLLEDGLDLWLVVLENTISMTPQLLQLFQNLPPLLEYKSENLRTCIHILQAGILLAPEQFLEAYGSAIVGACDEMLSDMRSEGIVMVMRLMETCFRAAPNTAIHTIMPVLPRVFRAVYRGEEYPLVMSMYLSMMARVLLFSQDVFSQIIWKVSQLENCQQEFVVEKILDVWLNKMPLVTQVERRKLLGLALAFLLTTQSSSVLQRFCGILLNIVEALNDIVRTDDDGVRIDSLVSKDFYSSCSEDEAEYETEHDRRRKRLAAADVIHTVVLEDYVKLQVIELQRQIGLTSWKDLLETVDSETLTQAREYIPL